MQPDSTDIFPTIASGPAPDAWLALFPAHQRAMIRAWFGYARTQGASTPADLVAVVARVTSAKLARSVSPTSTTLCEAVLASLAHHRGLALAYAQTLLDAQR